MKKFWIIATLALVATSCGNRNLGSGYYGSVYSPLTTTTYGNYNTSVGGVSGATIYTYPYNYSYYTPYYTPYYYSYNYAYYPYYYGYCNTCGNYYYYRYRPRYNWLFGALSELNFSFKLGNKSISKSASGENLRAQTFGNRTEIQYGEESGDKLNFFTDEKGKSFVSGKVKIEDTWVSVDPKLFKCNEVRSKLEEDPQNEVTLFDCVHGETHIHAEAYIPRDQQLGTSSN